MNTRMQLAAEGDPQPPFRALIIRAAAFAREHTEGTP